MVIGCDGMDEEMPEPFSAGELESLEPGTSLTRGPFRAACVMVDKEWLESLSVLEG